MGKQELLEVLTREVSGRHFAGDDEFFLGVADHLAWRFEVGCKEQKEILEVLVGFCHLRL
jgi:hypothetical protein